MTSNGAQQYNTATIRQLILSAFTPKELRRFCYDRPTFHPAVNRFGPGHSHDDMVDQLVEYCDRHVLFDQLLAEVKQVNPSQYARFEPDLRKELKKAPAETPAKPVPEKPAVATSPVQAVAKLSKDEPVPPLKGPGTGTVGGAKKRPAKSNEAQKHDGGERLRAGGKRLLLGTLALLLNLLIVGVAGILLILVLGPRLEELLPCTPLWTIGFGLPAIILAFLHVVWRSLHLVGVDIGEVLSFGSSVTARRDRLAAALGLGWPPFWVAFVGGLVVIASVLLSIFLVPGTPESMPIIESYLVLNSGAPVSLRPGEAAEQGIEIRPGHSVLIKVNIMDNADVQCTWESMQMGKLSPEQGCASSYRAPLLDSEDVISILIQSKCKTRERRVHLPVKIRDS